MQKVLSWILALCLLFPCFPAKAEPAPRLRALLVSCDDFVTYPDTQGAAMTNVTMMYEVLRADMRGYERIDEELGSIGSVDALRRAVTETFSGAGEQDISVFYISTHGQYNPARSNLSASLVLSDGEEEDLLNAVVLSDIFSWVNGTKVLILDACNSGAIIGKGLSDPADSMILSAPDIKVLCSAGGAEESWYWRSNGGSEMGASYFAASLVGGLSLGKGVPADENRDGSVTMKELQHYLLANYGVSTPQVYPQEDNFPLFSYDPGAVSITAAVGDFSFENTVLTSMDRQVSFSFTVRQPVTLRYQIVYYQRGAWQFSDAQMIPDAEQPLSPGRKKRTLTLTLSDEDLQTSGYAMLQIYSSTDDLLWLEGSYLLSIQPAWDDVALAVRVQAGRPYNIAQGEEVCVRVMHDVPCSLTVSVQNMRGETIRYLTYDAPARPQHLVPEGSTLYWNGTLADGSLAQDGRYIIKVRTLIGDKPFVAYSGTFEIISRSGKPTG